MLHSPRATPVEQPEDETRRRRHGQEQRMRRERAAGDRRGEPPSALRHETVTNWHQRGQHSQPADEPEHQQTKDRPFGCPVQPPAHARGAAGWPVRWVPHVCSVRSKAGNQAWASICPMSIPAQGTSGPGRSRHPVRAVHVVLAARRSGQPPVTLRTRGRGAIGPQGDCRYEIRAGLSSQGMRPESPARGMSIALRRDASITGVEQLLEGCW